MPPSTQSIPARTGKAVPLPKGHTIRIINTHGTQVVDFWAFTLSSSFSSSSSSSPPSTHLATFLSLPHTRATTLHLRPRVADILTTNLRSPILEFAADTSPGVHDTLIAACDPARYALLGCEPEHASCATNLRQGLRDVGIAWPGEGTMMQHWTPAPLNLWMNIPIREGAEGEEGVEGEKKLSFEPAVSRKGDYVDLKALVEGVVVVMSCCPQDKVPINSLEPKGVEFVVFEP